MKVLNIGSLNIDYRYLVDHITMPGETQTAKRLEVSSGGKGLNQSIALAKAGIEVYHAGFIGIDGQMLLQEFERAGVHTEWIRTSSGKNGNAVIQVDRNGENSILLYKGTNGLFTKEYIDEVISYFQQGDFLLLQNEVNELEYMIECGYRKGLTIAFNPSPFDESIRAHLLEKISILVLNEIEARQLVGNVPRELLSAELIKQFPEKKILLTMGKYGAVFCSDNTQIWQDVFAADVVDSTAAGDTFLGYFLSGIVKNKDIKTVLKYASAAASIAVSRAGASASIPSLHEVEQALNRRLP